MTTYIIAEYRPELKKTFYVCARPGFCLTNDGKFRRDGSLKGGPEHTTDSTKALQFKSHRAAARIATLCPSAKISAK